jgi:hypothetical protein
MKIKEACEIAVDCGLTTIGEAILNIELHAISLFSYDELSKELNELYEDAKNYHMNASVLTLL